MTEQFFSPTIGKLAAALSKAQGQIEGAKEDSVNPYFKSKYATLRSVWNSCQKVLPPNEIAVVQSVSNGGERSYLVTMLIHSSGEWVQSRMPILATKQDAQAFGSALSYCRRYGLAAMVGVCPADDDDDAESAMQETRKPIMMTISKSQIEEITRLLKGKDELQQKLLDWANITNIADLPAAKYTGAMKAIESHLSKEGAA